MMMGQRPNNYGCGKPMGRGQGNLVQTLGPCFKCGGNHWARDCPRVRPGMVWSCVERFCLGCHIDHLSKNCPEKPASNDVENPPNVSLNLMEVISSPPTSRNDEVATLHVVTRAQVRNEIQAELARKSSNKRRRRRKNKKSNGSNSPEELFKNDKRSKSQNASTKKLESSGRSPKKGGSMKIDPIDNPLRAIKIAMEKRVAIKESFLEKLATYPCAIEETTNLQFHQKLIEHN